MEPRTEKKSRFHIERLEERIAPSQLGSVVTLPQAGQGADAALATPAEHVRASLFQKKPVV